MASDFYIESIAKIIHDYAKQDRKMDAFYVEKMAEVIINEEGLEDYVLNKNYTDKGMIDKDSSGVYIPQDKAIFLNLKELNTTYKRIELEPHSKKDKKYARYVVGNEIILHEFGHAVFLKKSFSEEKDLETQLLQMSLYDDKFLYEGKFIRSCLTEILRISTEEVYASHYKFALEERLANIYAYRISQSIAKNLGAKGLYDYETYALYKTYLKTYKKVKSPTTFYLEQLGFSKKLEKMESEIQSLSFENRLRLGLSLNDWEYHQVQEEYKRLKKRIC